MINGKPGISSYDMFAMGHAIRSELRAIGGNLFNYNSTLMKLSNGDDDFYASLDPAIGTREVRKVSRRQIGSTVSSKRGGVGPTSTPARTASLLGNPYMRRYEGPDANGSYNFGLPGSPSVGEYYDVYESENNHLRFLDDTIGRDLLGYTHLENAAIERSGDAFNDETYLRSTYSVFGDINYPFDNQDIEAFRLGSKRYSPTEPYVLKPLEEGLTRRTMNGSVQGFKEKFEAFVPGREPYRGSLLDMWDYMGSHYYLNLLNGVAEHGLYVENYEMEPRERVAVYDREDMPQSDYAYFLNVDTMSPSKEIKGLLGKTNRMFFEGKIRSLANRFATLTGHDEGRPDFLNTATDPLYGLSRGRNLRKLDLTNENGYPNPYCRVWTTHYQYSKIKNLIRGKWMDDSYNSGNEHYTLHREDQLMRPNKGYERFKAMTSLNPENGMPIFSPYYVNDRSIMEKDSIKRCMFSIENLAWKDIIPDAALIRRNNDEKIAEHDGSEYAWAAQGYTETPSITSKTEASFYAATTHKVGKGTANGFGETLTPEQRGPNGGRIMWFPPYNLKFSETASANWNQNTFIGRGEKVFSYVNSERRGQLSFVMLVDHPSILNEWVRGGKLGRTANKVDQLGKDENILRFFAGCGALEFNPRKEFPVNYGYTADTMTLMFNSSTEQRYFLREPVKKSETSTTAMSSTSTTVVAEDNNPNNVSPDNNGTDLNAPNNDHGKGPGDAEDPAGNGGEDRTKSPTDEAQDKDSEITFYSIFYFPNNYAAEDFNNGKKPGGAVAGLDEMFKKGYRSSGNYGYEIGSEGTGMTYDGSYYASHKSNHKSGVTNYWYYPVDSRVAGEDLRTKDRYKDVKDFHLNTDFYGDFWKGSIPEGDELIKYLNEGNTSTLGGYGGDFEVAKSLVNVEAEDKYFVPAYYFYQHLEEVIRKFNAATNSRCSYDIVVQGFASSHGYVESNKILARNRAQVIANWMKTLSVFDFGGKDKISFNGNGQVPETDKTTESDFKPKAARAAVVTLKIKTKPGDDVLPEVQEYKDVEHIDRFGTNYNYSDSLYKEAYDISEATKYENDTYDDEYTYFKQISENDDMVKRYISDKVDYFNPAYHSITPEGFNSRLTFLQQCTRQGPTISASDLRTGSAYGAGNLSFGRPPVCVLRIGDFYNTKICIDSITINYDHDGMHWDLNPEGVGLQPMLAQITLNFTFLGGSDLSGPIARLQHAASFNYYANTSVYDRRSDYREGFVTPKDDTAKSWNPAILNKNQNANITEHVDFWTRTTDDPTGKIKPLT